MNTIWIKQSKYKFSSVSNLIKHQYRNVSLENENKFYGDINKTKSNWNLYINFDNKISISDSKLAFQKASKKWSEIFWEFKTDFEYQNFGHNHMNLQKLKEEIIKQNPNINQYNEDNSSLFWEIMKSKQNKNIENWNISLKKLIEKNNLSFDWFDGKKDKRNRKNFFDWEKAKDKNGNYKNKPISEFQIHISNKWFEQMGWVKYNYEKVFVKGKGIEKHIVGIEEILNKKALKEWFEYNVTNFRITLAKSFGEDNNKFIGAQLHLDESKPHINIQISNIERKFDKRVGYEKLGIVTRINDFPEIYDFKKLSYNFWKFNHYNFDKELKPPGFIKNYYGIKDYTTIDQLKENTFKIDYKNKDNFEKIINNEKEKIISWNKTILELEEIRDLIEKFSVAIFQNKNTSSIKAKLIVRIGLKKVQEIENNIKKEQKKEKIH